MDNLPKPITRVEHYLAKWAGMDVKTPQPITRIEHYLSELSKFKPEPELPEDYKRLIGFKFGASAYFVITGFHLRGSDTVRVSFSINKACNVFGCYTTTDADDNFSLYMSTASNAKYLRYDGAVYNSAILSANFGKRYDVVITPNGTTGMPTDSVITPATFETSVDLCIGTTSAGAASSKFDGNIWGDFVVDGRLKLIPCERVYDGQLGYYDAVSKTLHTATGSNPVSLGYAE